MSYFRPADGIFQGVIRDMVNNRKEDSIAITASCYPIDQFNTSTILNLDSDNYWVSEDRDTYNQYICMELKDRFVSLTHVSIRSPAGGYPKTWDFLASANGNSWDTLFSKSDSNILSSDKGITLKAMNKVYRFFKIVNKGQCEGTSYTTRLRISAIDIFGAVTPCNQNCQSNIPAYTRVPIICHTCKHKQVNIKYIFVLIVVLAKK